MKKRKRHPSRRPGPHALPKRNKSGNITQLKSRFL
jgi:hypothetical protein